MFHTKAEPIGPRHDPSEFCLPNIDLRKRTSCVRTGISRNPSRLATWRLRRIFVKRENHLMRIALIAGRPLGHEAAVDGPNRPSVNSAVRTLQS